MPLQRTALNDMEPKKPSFFGFIFLPKIEVKIGPTEHQTTLKAMTAERPTVVTTSLKMIPQLTSAVCKSVSGATCNLASSITTSTEHAITYNFRAHRIRSRLRRFARKSSRYFICTSKWHHLMSRTTTVSLKDVCS
jgi:hypothetical protein